MAHAPLYDDLERTDAGLSDDVAFAVVQMKAEMMARIDVALDRLEAGTYGSCGGCGLEITETIRRKPSTP